MRDIPIDADRKQQTGSMVVGQNQVNAPAGALFIRSIQVYDSTTALTGDNDYLAKKLSQSDIYLTASEEEAGANHVLEALASGTPVLYHSNGGSVNNYCGNYGVEYSNFRELLAGLVELKENYLGYKEKTMSYSKTIDDTIQEYKKIIYDI